MLMFMALCVKWVGGRRKSNMKCKELKQFLKLIAEEVNVKEIWFRDYIYYLKDNILCQKTKK
jgi:hypothetical protein